MKLKFGLHTRPQFLSIEELTKAWRRADEGGFYWVSVADRLYTNPIHDRRQPCFEAVAAMAHLASVTQNVRVGCLMFNVQFRHPGVLVKAMTTIDHISGGRVEFGLGAGGAGDVTVNMFPEYNDFGITEEPFRTRMDRLEEVLQFTRVLLRGEPTDFTGEHYQLRGAICAPKPIGSDMRLWVGGLGLRKTPQLAARYADGFNIPYMTIDECTARFDALKRFCEQEDRSPDSVMKSVSLNFYMGADEQAAARSRKEFEDKEPRKAGALLGGVTEVIDTVDAYRKAGADIVNMVFRHSIDWEAYEAFIEEVVPHFQT